MREERLARQPRGVVRQTRRLHDGVVDELGIAYGGQLDVPRPVGRREPPGPGCARPTKPSSSRGSVPFTSVPSG
ncbi:hypothetical protein ACFZCU_24040 [Streptomyces canus]|uniref:hypothetical protein n=1 Tax=Streptomyces canus TaxID=58343 RepID=UPI0036EFD556